MEMLEREEIVRRIWARDHTVWKPDPTEIADRLGWLDVMDQMRPQAARLRAFGDEVVAAGFTDVVLLGMGGSSLAPEVIRSTLGAATRALDLTVLDTTHPGALASVEERLDLDRSLFLVASKSGSTIETRSHLEYFWAQRPEGERFIAVTDAGSGLEKLARERGFREVFVNPSDIGGRYSALSLFGLVPAALIGADVDALLDDASEMASACRSEGHENPGAALGYEMGRDAEAGFDKLTLVVAPELGTFGAWVEQLVAESTGKEGKGILPVVDEDLGAPEVYGEDRLFVSVGKGGDKLDALEAAGLRVIRIEGDARLGAEFFRFEFATAVAGAVMRINPFDQPNVAEAKEATGKILDGDTDPVDAGDARALLDTLQPRDYVAIQAYLDPFGGHGDALQRVRLAIRDDRRVATTTGYGPRFLHSTGQLHKGGADNGVFLQVVDDDANVDRQIPGASYSFRTLLDAQALGDLRSLRARGRRVARLTLDELEEVVR